MSQLRKEAQKGNETVEARNIMLQKSLTKLTNDFEVAAKDLRVSNNKIRELEYELEQMIIELNTKGENLKKATNNIYVLKNNLLSTGQELADLQNTHEQLILQKAKIEADARADNLEKEHQKQELRKRLDAVGKDLASLQDNTSVLESDIQQKKFEIEELKHEIINLQNRNDNLHKELNETKSTLKKEVGTRDEKIRELNDRIAKDTAKMKLLEEKKEQLLFQVTDLRNNLDMEQKSLKSLTEEYAEYRTETTQQVNNLTEQVEKLTEIKSNLSNDKKDLTDKIKVFRQELREKEEELEETQNRFEEFQQNTTSEISSLVHKLASLTEDHKLLGGQHENLKERYSDSVKELVGVKLERDAALKRGSELEIELGATKDVVISLTIERDGLLNEVSMWKDRFEELNNAYQLSVGGAEDVAQQFAAYKAEAERKSQDKEEEIFKIMHELEDKVTTIKILNNSNSNLEFRLSDVEAKLKQALLALEKETETRQTLEDRLHENRKAFQYERRVRFETERINNSLKFDEVERAIDRDSDWAIRERNFNDAYESFESESLKLQGILERLPKDWGKENDFVWPTNIPGLPKKPPKKVQ
jgi:chromosome segregation ATPase